MKRFLIYPSVISKELSAAEPLRPTENFQFQSENKQSGQSLIEILVAVAVGAIMIIAAAGVIVPVLRIGTQTNRAQIGTSLARELLDNVRVWGEGDWHNIFGLATSSANHYYLVTNKSPFSSSTGDESVTVSSINYARYFYLDDVYRDSGGNIINATSGTVFVDPSTKKVTIAYSWPASTTSTIYGYISRYRNNVFDQTDWSGGPGQDGPATSTNGQFSTSTNIDYTTSSGSIYIRLH